MLLPGNTASSACHQHELEHFGQQYHTVSLDFRGTGQSERWSGWPVDWWAQGGRDAIALADHLGEEQVILIGASGGAAAALYAALEFPGRVRAVIADSLTHYLPPEQLRAEVAKRRQKQPEAVKFWQSAHGDDWEKVVEEDNQLMLRFAEDGGEFFPQGLAAIHCPVLFTLSLTDSLLYQGARQAAEMAAQLPESQVFMFNGGDHPLMWSRPEEFLHTADVFLQSKAT
jgi:pimeloyl-ACP methyl ester carboxylesterase